MGQRMSSPEPLLPQCQAGWHCKEATPTGVSSGDLFTLSYAEDSG